MYIYPMQNVAEIFAAWPSDAEFGRDIGVPYPTVSAWKQRESIPATYWWHIIRAAARRGHPEITAELLARLHARKANNGLPPGFAEEDRPSIAGPEATPRMEHPSDNGAAVGHFSRWKHLRRANFASPGEIAAHVSALREEWERR
jgi:hypothetical protein